MASSTPLALNVESSISGTRLERRRPSRLAIPTDEEINRPRTAHPRLPSPPRHAHRHVKSPATSAARNRHKVTLSRCHLCGLLSVPPCRTCHLFLPKSFAAPPAHTDVSHTSDSQQPYYRAGQSKSFHQWDAGISSINSSAAGDSDFHEVSLASDAGGQESLLPRASRGPGASDVASWLNLRTLPCRMMGFGFSTFHHTDDDHGLVEPRLADAHPSDTPSAAPRAAAAAAGPPRAATAVAPRDGALGRGTGDAHAAQVEGKAQSQDAGSDGKSEPAADTWEIQALWEWAGQVLTWQGSIQKQPPANPRSLRHTVTAPARMSRDTTGEGGRGAQCAEGASRGGGWAARGGEEGASGHGEGQREGSSAGSGGASASVPPHSLSPMVVWLQEARRSLVMAGEDGEIGSSAASRDAQAPPAGAPAPAAANMCVSRSPASCLRVMRRDVWRGYELQSDQREALWERRSMRRPARIQVEGV